MYPHLWAGQPQGLLQASQPPGVFQPGKRQLTSLTSHLLSALSWPPAHSPPPRSPPKVTYNLTKAGLACFSPGQRAGCVSVRRTNF